jgi:hypothetical protein
VVGKSLDSRAPMRLHLNVTVVGSFCSRMLLSCAVFQRRHLQWSSATPCLGLNSPGISLVDSILELKANGDGILKIGRKLGIGTSVVQRVFKQVAQPS